MEKWSKKHSRRGEDWDSRCLHLQCLFDSSRRPFSGFLCLLWLLRPFNVLWWLVSQLHPPGRHRPMCDFPRIPLNLAPFHIFHITNYKTNIIYSLPSKYYCTIRQLAPTQKAKSSTANGPSFYAYLHLYKWKCQECATFQKRRGRRTF